MAEMSKGYIGAQTTSYAGQEDEVVILGDKLGEITEIPLGFQPLGIASNGSRVAIAAYFEPAICLVQVAEDNGLRLKVRWIRGVQHESRSVRLFPDIAKPIGANRAQTVNFGERGAILATRNTGRDFFTLVPSPQSPWWYLGDKITLPGSKSWMVHSALLSQECLAVIESSKSLRSWTWNEYNLEGKAFRITTEPTPMPEYMYGIGQRPGDSSPWFVTDFRCSSKPGIYRGEELVVPGVFGTGICFLPNGGALVSRYGQGHPFAFNGVPGALIHIPANLLK